MNDKITNQIIGNIDLFKAARCINESFEAARFQKLKNLVKECWSGTEEIQVNNMTIFIIPQNKSYNITFQYNHKIPYYGISRKEKKSNYSLFKIDGWDEANDWWIASQYVNKDQFKYNWSDAHFLAEQWDKDNFESFKAYIKECLNEIKKIILANSEKIDTYSNEI